MDKTIDILLDSGNFSAVDELGESKRTNKGPKRSKFRNKMIHKMYSIREVLKWKFNYFEANPREHKSFPRCLRAVQANSRTKKFKKWRLMMDEFFNEETSEVHRVLLKREMKNLNQKQSADVSIPDPTRLLVNFDRAVLNMIRHTRDEFSFFLKYPKCCPLYNVEKENS